MVLRGLNISERKVTRGSGTSTTAVWTSKRPAEAVVGVSPRVSALKRVVFPDWGKPMIPSFILTLLLGICYTNEGNAEVAEQADAHDSKSCSFGIVGSIPTFGTGWHYNMPLPRQRRRAGMDRLANVRARDRCVRSRASLFGGSIMKLYLIFLVIDLLILLIYPFLYLVDR